MKGGSVRGEIADAGANRGGRTTAHRVGELAGFFLKLGMIAFGGPAAHLAMMDAEVVRKRGWLTREQFLDLLGAANLIPGPSSTEMAIYIGLVRAGWRGLIVAGTCFILPAMVIVLALAVAYVEYGYVLLAFLRADLDGVTFALGLAATLAVFTLRVNSAWLVLGGGMVGLALKMLG